MDGDETSQKAPKFRSNKRRKVLRRRSSGGELEQVFVKDQSEASGDLLRNDRIQQTSAAPVEPPESESGISQVRRRKKHGVAFSSKQTGRSDREGDLELSALVPYEAQNIATPVDRFVKPSGKTVVADDRHISAYVDSKVAEYRSAAVASLGVVSPRQDDVVAADGSNNESLGLSSKDTDGNPQTQSERSGSGAADILQSNRVMANKPTRRKRQHALRTDSDVARDSLVDQIMRESMIPMYEAESSRHQQPADPDGQVDNDAAAVAAFKADFLASMEEKNLSRRLPTINPAAQTGPKLGGSRSAREKMKALEEQNKGKGGSMQK